MDTVEEMAKGRPIVDITSIVAVESLFRPDDHDPWGQAIAGHFADFFIYSDEARFILPYSKSPDNSNLPSLLQQLMEREPGVFRAEPYEVDGPAELDPDHYRSVWGHFSTWAHKNMPLFKRWLHLHRQPWIKNGHMARVRPRYVFDKDLLVSLPDVCGFAESLDMDVQEVCYALDVVLRYSLYGTIAGPNAYYLAHPIRELPHFPTMERESAVPPSVPISFRKTMAMLAPRVSQDEYTSLLHEARGVVRDRHIVGAKPLAIDRETIRDVAAQLRLPARIKNIGMIEGVSGALISLGGLRPGYELGTSLAGVAISLAPIIWKGYLPGTLSRMRWLRWALEWDIEEEVSNTA